MKHLRFKKFICLALAFCLCLCLAGCGKNKNTNTANNSTPGGKTTPSNNASQPGNDSGNANTVPPAADHSEECLNYIKGLYPYIEKSLQQDPDIKHLYGWETAALDENTYLVAYALDYDNSSISDGYAILGYECRVSDGKINAVPVTDASVSGKYESMGYTLYRQAPGIIVNAGYFTDEFYLIDRPEIVINALRSFFENLGVQPYIYTMEADEDVSASSAATQKYQELFAYGNGEIDGNHILIMVLQDESETVKVEAYAGSDAEKKLGLDCEKLISGEFTDRWENYDDFSELTADAMNSALYKLYDSRRDPSGSGQSVQIPASLVFVDTEDQTTSEYYPTINFSISGSFEYNMNMYEGMYLSGGSYSAYLDANGNITIECTISETPDEEGLVSEYDGSVFRLAALKDSGIWLYLGEDTGMTWDRSIFRAAMGAQNINVTLK